MPRAIRKMTGAVADRFSISGRGYVKPGYFADLTVFDETRSKTRSPTVRRPLASSASLSNGYSRAVRSARWTKPPFVRPGARFAHKVSRPFTRSHARQRRAA
jgi:adenine deaminase